MRRVWVEHANQGDLWLNQWGADQLVEVLVDGKLYWSAVPGAQTTSIAADTPVVAGWGLVFTGAGETHAQTVCHTVAYGEYGAYGFAYRIDRARQPAATKDFLAGDAASPLWLPEETTMVRRTPVIHTAATKWSTTNAGVETVYFTDEIWQTGWPEDPEDTDAHGAVAHPEWPGYGPWEPDGKTIRVELWRIEGEVD